MDPRPDALVALDDIDRYLETVGDDLGRLDTLDRVMAYVERYGKSHAERIAATKAKLKVARHGGRVLIDMAERGERKATGRNSPATGPLPALGDLGLTKNRSSRWQSVARLPEAAFQERLATIDTEDADESLAAQIMGGTKASTSVEWYTPARYIEAARGVMGGIDLDPATSALANQTVRAARIFTREDDGLAHDWQGRVWLNPPYWQGQRALHHQARRRVRRRSRHGGRPPAQRLRVRRRLVPAAMAVPDLLHRPPHPVHEPATRDGRARQRQLVCVSRAGRPDVRGCFRAVRTGGPGVALALADRSQIVIDLDLAGFRFVARMEGCKCEACRAFDLDFDADILARDRRGRPVIVAYRRQTRYAYETITTRFSTDRGSTDSQVRKLLTGKSLAAFHLQSYRDYIVIADAASLRKALQQRPLFRCREHGEGRIIGEGGQTFIPTCRECMPWARVIHR